MYFSLSITSGAAIQSTKEKRKQKSQSIEEHETSCYIEETKAASTEHCSEKKTKRRRNSYRKGQLKQNISESPYGQTVSQESWDILYSQPIYPLYSRTQRIITQTDV